MKKLLGLRAALFLGLTIVAVPTLSGCGLIDGGGVNSGGTVINASQTAVDEQLVYRAEGVFMVMTKGLDAVASSGSLTPADATKILVLYDKAKSYLNVIRKAQVGVDSKSIMEQYANLQSAVVDMGHIIEGK